MSIANLFKPNYYDLNCKDINISGSLDVNQLEATDITVSDELTTKTLKVTDTTNNSILSQGGCKLNGDLAIGGTTKTLDLHVTNDAQIDGDTTTTGTLNCNALDCDTSAGIGTLDFKNNATLLSQATGGAALISTSIVFYKLASNLAFIFLPHQTNGDGASVNYINFIAGTIPTLYRPSEETNICIPIISNGVMANGLLRLGSNGSILIVNPAGNFPASPALNGWARFCVLYVL